MAPTVDSIGIDDTAFKTFYCVWLLGPPGICLLPHPYTHTHTRENTHIYTDTHSLNATTATSAWRGDTSDIPNASNASGTSLATAVKKDSGLGVSAS